jgi:hypothetical protein
LPRSRTTSTSCSSRAPAGCSSAPTPAEGPRTTSEPRCTPRGSASGRSSWPVQALEPSTTPPSPPKPSRPVASPCSASGRLLPSRARPC